MILITSNTSDPEASSLESNLDGVLRVELRDVLEVPFLPNPDSDEFRQLESDLVWYLPGQFDMLEEGMVSDDSDACFLARQYRVAVEFFESWMTRNCMLVDAPSRLRRATNRLWQLDRLERFVPSAVLPARVVFRPSEVVPGQVLKRLSESRVVSQDLRFFARRVSGEHVAAGANRFAPMLMQPEVVASVEYRTFVFGRESVSVELPRVDVGQGVDTHEFGNSAGSATLVDHQHLAEIWSGVTDALEITTYAVDYFAVDGRPRIMEVNPLFGWTSLPGECQREVVAAAGRFVQSIDDGPPRSWKELKT